MNIETLISNLNSPDYNFHSHTQYCDGRAPMSAMAEHAFKAGFKTWGFSPHSPLPEAGHPMHRKFPFISDCNMTSADVEPYLHETKLLADKYEGKMQILAGMEIDYLSRDWGAHIDYFQNLPLHYKISSVHFIPTQDGFFVDCDGSAKRFTDNLHQYFKSDLRYVVEKYFEQELNMIECGGFDIIGHCDKIIANAIAIDPEIGETSWYHALMQDVINNCISRNIIIEINTKAIQDRGRFFPDTIWWKSIKDAKHPVIINSDAHYPDKVTLGRKEALETYAAL